MLNIEQLVHDLDSPGAKRKSQNSIFGSVERTQSKSPG